MLTLRKMLSWQTQAWARFLFPGYFRNGMVSPGFTVRRGSIMAHPVCSVSISELTTFPRRSTSKSARSCLPCHFILMRTVLSWTVCFSSVRLSTSECTLTTNAIFSLLLIVLFDNQRCRPVPRPKTNLRHGISFQLTGWKSLRSAQTLSLTNATPHAPKQNPTKLFTHRGAYGSKRILRDFSPFFIISKPFLYSSRGSRWVTTPSVGSLPLLMASMTKG